MLEEKDIEVIGETLGAAVDLLAEVAQAMAEKLSNIAQGSMDEYVPLVERLSEFIEEPDRGAGFVLVGNDTWLPKHLVDARKQQRRKMSRLAESSIVWTR